jgi:hypothetical protein
MHQPSEPHLMTPKTHVQYAIKGECEGRGDYIHVPEASRPKAGQIGLAFP